VLLVGVLGVCHSWWGCLGYWCWCWCYFGSFVICLRFCGCLIRSNSIRASSRTSLMCSSLTANGGGAVDGGDSVVGVLRLGF
jgi:hypothetical protein